MNGDMMGAATSSNLNYGRNRVLEDLWSQLPFAPGSSFSADMPSWVRLAGKGGAPSSFRVAELAEASIAGAALAAAGFWNLRGGHPQSISVERHHALAEFHSESYLDVGGSSAGEIRSPLSQLFRAADGWVRLHANYPHHRDGLLALLGCENSVEAVKAALLTWRAMDFEDRATEQGLVAAALRSFEEWDRHPHAAYIRQQPLIALERVGEAPPASLERGDRPLSGIRVLDLTHIISGPVAGRTLAAHGADVLHVTSPKLPAIPALDIDTGRGKKACAIDLAEVAGRAKLANLLERSDVFLQSYRPGSLDRYGFSCREVVRARPGIVYVSLSAYGDAGPWGGKRGFDSLVQTATGFNAAEGDELSPGQPRALPVQALDHATGYLAVIGIIAALDARARLGGSWRVSVSLARTGLWLRSLGRAKEIGTQLPKRGEIDQWRETQESPFGTLSFVRHSATMSGTPTRWIHPSVPLDYSAADWW